jgi:hypothetical protein
MTNVTGQLRENDETKEVREVMRRKRCKRYRRKLGVKMCSSKTGSLTSQSSSLARQYKGDDEAIEGERFGENEDEDHDDEELGLLGRSANTSVTDDADTNTGSKARETVGQARREMSKAKIVGIVAFLDVANEDNGDNQTIDTEDTSHDNRDNRAHDQLGCAGERKRDGVDERVAEALGVSTC